MAKQLPTNKSGLSMPDLVFYKTGPVMHATSCYGYIHILRERLVLIPGLARHIPKGVWSLVMQVIYIQK